MPFKCERYTQFITYESLFIFIIQQHVKLTVVLLNKARKMREKQERQPLFSHRSVASDICGTNFGPNHNTDLTTAHASTKIIKNNRKIIARKRSCFVDSLPHIYHSNLTYFNVAALLPF